MSIDDARIIVSGGRGVGGAGGLRAAPGPRRRARRRRRGDARGGRLRLDRLQPADRPDGQDRQAAAVPRARHQRGDPAQGRDADRRDHRRRQPRPGRADRRVRRPVRRRRPVRGRARAARPSFGRGQADAGDRGRPCPSSLLLLPIIGVRRPGGADRDRPAAGRPDRRPDARPGGIPGADPRPRRAGRRLARRGDRPDRRRPARPGRRRHHRRRPIAAATDAVERYADEARALRGPPEALADPRRHRRPSSSAPGGPWRWSSTARRSSPRSAAAAASSRPRPRSSAATSTCSMPGRPSTRHAPAVDACR